MKIAIATCQEKPELSNDDQKLAAHLKSKGAQVQTLIWTDPLPEDFDLILIRTTWDYHLHYEKFLNWISAIEKLDIRLFNPAATIRWNADKSYLMDLQKKGVPCVPSKIFFRDDQNEKFILETFQQRPEIVIKPTVSATAYLTGRYTQQKQTDLLEQCREILNHSDLLIQQFIESIQSDGEVSLIFFNSDKASGIEFSHAVLKTAKSGDFRIQSDFGGRAESVSVPASLIDFGKSVLSHVQSRWLYARVDLLNWQSHPLVGEIEMIEPDLFLRTSKVSIEKFAQLILTHMS